ncbi:hypothetical protein [Metallosphaera javensis (ex Hofmann et al. 2022)]|nr:hypothetical protein [Metallosphaera javensis (ex Hofmann et al. 2022)]
MRLSVHDREGRMKTGVKMELLREEVVLRNHALPSVGREAGH